jgi:hypothetical protein
MRIDNLENLQALKSGNKLVVKDNLGKGYILASVRHATRWNFDIKSPFQSVFLLSDLTQLHDCVQKIPDMAWDVLDFATQPLILFLSEPKENLKVYANEEGRLGVMLLKEGVLQQLVHKMQSATMMLYDLNQVSNLSDGDISLNLSTSVFPSMGQIKKMWLGIDGQVKIY